ncbi:MAG: complex I NDUFA9 subunit family protein [Betaproteobacteria bacterium]|nr:complex I NDUFA9 subunit family protein [Betaproteobacteria bacterium]
MKYNRVLVLGGSGFVGRHLVAALVRRGVRVTVPSRHRERAKHLILLPTVDVVEADINHRGVLDRLAKGQDAIINLVGILHGDFQRAHVEIPMAVIAASRVAGVERIVHMSALGASPDAPSEYLRTKAMAEQALLDADDRHVTVFRPSVIFGPEDRFLNQFSEMAKWLAVLAVPCPDARFQPVYVGDVARAMAVSLEDTETFGQKYDLAGPREYNLKQLVELVCTLTHRRRLVIGLPDKLSFLQAAFLEMLPGPLMTRDNYYSMKVPNTTSAPWPLGGDRQPLEAIAPTYLVPSGPRERYPQFRWRARR